MTFEDCRPDIETQVDGPRGDDGALRGNFVECLAERYDARLYFVRRGRALQGRARALHDAARGLADRGAISRANLPGRNDLEFIGRKAAVSLFVAMRLGRFFNECASIEDQALHDLLLHRLADGTFGRFSFSPNEVVPSLYCAKSGVIQEIREAAGLKKAKLGRILFEDNGEELIDLHENAHPPCVTFYFAQKVHARLVAWAQTSGIDIEDFEDPTDLFKRIGPTDHLHVLTPAQGNDVPER